MVGCLFHKHIHDSFIPGLAPPQSPSIRSPPTVDLLLLCYYSVYPLVLQFPAVFVYIFHPL
jgi:hypothetical protein